MKIGDNVLYGKRQHKMSIIKLEGNEACCKLIQSNSSVKHITKDLKMETDIFWIKLDKLVLDVPKEVKAEEVINEKN